LDEFLHESAVEDQGLGVIARRGHEAQVVEAEMQEEAGEVEGGGGFEEVEGYEEGEVATC
jgi:hypothetical protein